MSATASVRAPTPHHHSVPDVTVVVPVRDGGDEMLDLVAALECQTLGHGRFEVVVADDGSRDGATDRLPRKGWLRVLSSSPQNSYAARNRGAAAARGEILAFCDADCRPEPHWLAEGLAALGEAEVVGGAIRFAVPDRPSTWSLLDMDTFLDQERAVGNGTAVSANLFVRRPLFDALGGFDATLPNNGDFDFVSRAVGAGATLAYAAHAIVVHPTRDERAAFLKKAWNVNRRYAARQARQRSRPEALQFRSLVPLVQPIRSRRRTGRTLTLDRRRLGENGVTPTAAQRLRALPLQYVLLPYLAIAAQARGWVEGRRMR